MDASTWVVTYFEPGMERATKEQVTADGWQIGVNGDLVFVNDPYGSRPFFLRAFAAGTWLEVSLYA